MATERSEFTTPVGRLVAGSVYQPKTTDGDGNPLVIKNGPNKGQPRVEYYFALAIPKGAEQHWSQTEWGALIWKAGAAAFPAQCQSPTFAWKVADGDSQIPNGKGTKPCDREGWRGHWVVHFSSGQAPKLFNDDGTKQLVEPDAIKTGYFAQVFGNVAGNDSAQRPGVFINHRYVALSGYGQVIETSGVDAASVGFGGAALPAGASTTPPAGFNPAPAAPAMPPLPPAAAAPTMPPPNVTPAHDFAAGPGATPPAPPAPPAGPVMTAKATGTYDQYRAAGWTDAQLVEHGFMTAA